MAEEELDNHTIELADTKPVMWNFPFIGMAEIPRSAAIIIYAAVGIIYSQFGWKYLAIHPAAWVILHLLIKDNPHGITHIQRWFEIGYAFCLTRKYNGGVCATPFPTNKNGRRGII